MVLGSYDVRVENEAWPRGIIIILIHEKSYIIRILKF